MNPAMSIPEVRWFVRGPKVAIFEMSHGSVDGRRPVAVPVDGRRPVAVPVDGPPPVAEPVDIDVSELGPPPPASHRRLKVDQTEEIDESDILAEFPADLTPETAPSTPALFSRPLASIQEDEPTRPLSRPYRRRSGWLVAVVVGTVAGLVLATGLSFYARSPILQTARAHTKAASAKSLVPSAARLGAVVPTVNVYSLPRAR